MNEVLAVVQEERRKEREPKLGPHSLSVISVLVQNYAPEGMDILAIGSSKPYTIGANGMVHFPAPVGALVSEKAFRDRKHVMLITLPENGINGNSFTPLVTEQDSDLYAHFKRYMPELVQHTDWRSHRLPGNGLNRSLTEIEQNMWDKWIRIEMGRNPESDKERWSREQAL